MSLNGTPAKEARRSSAVLLLNSATDMGRFEVNRFKGHWAVLKNDARTFTVPRAWLPSDTEERDVITITKQVPVGAYVPLHFELDAQAREQRHTDARTHR